MCLFFINTFCFAAASSDFSDTVQKTALVLRLPAENNLNFERELKEFKQRVDKVRQLYGQVWLVVAASLGSEIERVRFHDPRWVFWNVQISEKDGIHADGRLGIMGDGLASKNWQSIAAGLENSFDLITDDWAFEYPTDNLYGILHSMRSMLRVGGQAMMKIQNFDHALTLGLDNEKELDWIEENLDLGHTPSSPVPFRHGAGGSDVCQSLASYSSETRHAIPIGSKCDLYLKEIEPKYREKEERSLFCLDSDCLTRTKSFLCRLVDNIPTITGCRADGMRLLIDEVKPLVAQSVKGWEPPVARPSSPDELDKLSVGSVVFQKKASK